MSTTAGPTAAAICAVVSACPVSYTHLQGHRLEPDVGVPWPSTKVHVLVEELAQSEMIGQRRWLDQPGIGDGMVVIEGHQNPVRAVRR